MSERPPGVSEHNEDPDCEWGGYPVDPSLPTVSA